MNYLQVVQDFRRIPGGSYLDRREQLSEAAAILERHPQALQLHYLETLTVIAADKNSTIVFPLPLDIIGPLLRLLDRKPASPAE